MSQADRHSQNVQALRYLESLRTAHQPNGWVKRLASYAEKGYPTGASSGSRGSEINRPTERLALSPDDLPAARYRRLQEVEHLIAILAREYQAIYLWTTTTIPKAEPLNCNNAACSKPIYDVARKGRCSKCAQWYRRHNAEWPVAKSENEKP